MTPAQQQRARDALSRRLSELGMTQRWLAGELGIPEARVSDLMHGRQPLSWERCIRIAELLFGDFDVSGDVWFSVFGEELPEALRS